MELYPNNFLRSSQEFYQPSFGWLREAKIGPALAALLSSSLLQISLRGPYSILEARRALRRRGRKNWSDELLLHFPFTWLP